MPNNPENTNLENMQQNTNANNNDNTNSTANNDRPHSEKYYNKKSVLAFRMFWIMLAVGIIIIISIVASFGTLLEISLIVLLLLAVIVGCIFTIIRATQGAREIASDRKNQKGTALSVLAILGAI